MSKEIFYKGYHSEVQRVNLSKVAELESDGAEIWTVWLQSLLSPLYYPTKWSNKYQRIF